MTTAPQTFGPGAVMSAEAIHVTGRRVVATIIDGLIFGVAYWLLLEGYLGQTLGKMAVGIKVVAEATGQAPGIAAAAIRTLLRIVDGLLCYTVAFVTVLVSDNRQRFGDMAARTLVVRA